MTFISDNYIYLCIIGENVYLKCDQIDCFVSILNQINFCCKGIRNVHLRAYVQKLLSTFRRFYDLKSSAEVNYKILWLKMANGANVVAFMANSHQWREFRSFLWLEFTNRDHFTSFYAWLKLKFTNGGNLKLKITNRCHLRLSF